MDHKFNKGDHIVITLTNGTSYEGDVKNFSETFQRLSLKNITQHPGNVIIEGVRHFESTEISKMKVVHLPDSPVSMTNNEVIADNANQDTFVTNGITRKISDSELQKIEALQNSFCYIDSPTTDYDSVITKLQESEVVGLYAKDTTRGRSERASVIVLSTKSNIFIFDLVKLGDKVFDKGLREVLQSEGIKKVVHDCRLLSDCLYHKHQTKLVNVRDVEAEDVMVVHQERGCIRKHSRPFGYLTETYLGIPREGLNETDLTESWRGRPLSPAHLKFLATYASFLIPLHEAIERYFLQRLVNASTIYNEYLRDSDMYVYVTQDCQYVLHNKLTELVKHKATCRGIKAKST